MGTLRRLRTSRSIRKLVGGGAAALALAGFLALLVAPRLAGASSGSHLTLASSGFSSVITNLRTEQAADIEKKSVSTAHRAATPSGACTSAKANLSAAIAQDRAEDARERVSATPASDVAEDRAEYAARKPLVDAVRAACGFTKPPPSPQCAAALQSLKAAFLAERGEDEAERAARTEDSPADVIEDQAEKARLAALWQKVRSSCGFGTRTGDFSMFGSTRTWSVQH